MLRQTNTHSCEHYKHTHVCGASTVSLFDDTQSLQLKLHVLLDHQGAKHLKIICGENWLENSLFKEENHHTDITGAPAALS